MAIRNGLIGAAALGLAALTGCAESEITIEGDAAYCIREPAANENEATTIGIYIDATFHLRNGKGGFFNISTEIFGSHITSGLFEMNYDAHSTEQDYFVSEDLAVYGFVDDIDISVKTSLHYESFPLEEVDCGTLDEMIKH